MGGFLKRGAWTIFRFKGGEGLGKKEEVGVFEGRRVDTPMHTISSIEFNCNAIHLIMPMQESINLYTNIFY